MQDAGGVLRDPDEIEADLITNNKKQNTRVRTGGGLHNTIFCVRDDACKYFQKLLV